MGKAQHTTKIGRPAVVPGEKPTSDKIFDAAIELFAQNGYDRTSIRQIASAVGLTESAIYRHYSSKESLLDAIFAYAESRIYAPMPIESNTGDYKGQSIFRGLLAPLPEIIQSDPTLIKIIKIMYSEIHHNAKIRAYFQKEYVERADEYLGRLFEAQIEKGLLRKCNPRVLAGVFNAFRSEWSFQNFILDHDTPLDTAALKKGLDDSIAFFEMLLVP